jgi:hypothetical protein
VVLAAYGVARDFAETAWPRRTASPGPQSRKGLIQLRQRGHFQTGPKYTVGTANDRCGTGEEYGTSAIGKGGINWQLGVPIQLGDSI